MPSRSSHASSLAAGSEARRSEDYPTVLLKLDAESLIVWASGQLAGQPVDCLTGSHFAGLWPGDSCAAVERALERARTGTLQRVGVTDPVAQRRLSLLINRSVTNEPGVSFFVVAAPRTPEVGGLTAFRRGLSPSSTSTEPEPDAPRQIVIADDEALLLSLSAKLLELEGHEIELVANGNELMDRLDSEDPLDLVVLDLSLPGPSPAALLRAITERDPAPAVLVATGSSREQALEQLGDGTGWSYLQKPYSNEALASRVEELLEGD